MIKQPVAIIGMMFLLISCSQPKQNNISITDVGVASSKDFLSEQEEIALGKELETKLLGELEAKQIPYDQDQTVLNELTQILNRLTEVSHRPKLTWKVHFAEIEQDNAFSLPGGVIFLFQGLVKATATKELERAAILAHEIGHIAARHLAEKHTVERCKKSLFARIESSPYPPCYTPTQEDEADKHAMLYLALAGYNPDELSNIWFKLHVKELLPHQMNYGRDHQASFSIDRYKNAVKCAQIAKEYLSKDSKANPKYSEILQNNKLTGFTKPVEIKDTEPVKIVDKTAPKTTPEVSTKKEVIKKEDIKDIQIDSIQHDKNNLGQAIVVAWVTNKCEQTARHAEIVLQYLDNQDKVIYTESKWVEDLKSKERKSTTFLIRGVSNCVNLKVVVQSVKF